MPARSDMAITSDTRLKVLLADDYPAFLESTRKLLEPEYHVIGTVTNGLMALKMAMELRPDVIVLDIEMPGIDGIRVAQDIKRSGLRARIFFLTVHEDADYRAAALAVGDGYVLKARMGTDLRHAIQQTTM